MAKGINLTLEIRAKKNLMDNNAKINELIKPTA